MNFTLNIIAKTSVILFSAALFSITLRRASASTRHAIWLLAMVSAVLLPLAAIVTPQLEWPVLPQGTTTVTFFSPGTVERELSSSTAYVAETLRQAGRLWVEPGFLWLLGFGVLLSRLVLGTLAVRRIASSAKVNRDQGYCGLMKEMSAALSLKKPAALLFSDSQISPMTWGLLRHTILLPSSAAQWSMERRRLVLAHELAHVKRRDGMIQIVVQIICSIYWFNPLIWYAAHRVRIERERACDDQVLNMGTAAEDYADHLVQIVRGLRARHVLSFAAVSMAQPSQLETRLVSLLDSRVRRRRMSKLAAACLSAMTGLLTISIAAIGVTGAVPPAPVSAITMKFAAPPAPAALPAPVPQPAVKPAGTPQRTRIANAGTIPNNAIVPPHVIESKPAFYTDEALNAGIAGTVTLEVDVDIDGKFKILRVVKGLGYGLDQRAMGAVLDWKFAPAMRNGARVRAITQVDVEYKLPTPRENPFFIAAVDGNGVMRLVPSVTPPTVISRVEPQYSDEARAARYQGTVVLDVIIRRDGTVDVVRVVRSLGFGLDENAVDAIKRWRFKPGTRNGVPVDVSLNVEVNFNLK